jgi:hypothetical protein
MIGLGEEAEWIEGGATLEILLGFEVPLALVWPQHGHRDSEKFALSSTCVCVQQHWDTGGREGRTAAMSWEVWLGEGWPKDP